MKILNIRLISIIVAVFVFGLYYAVNEEKAYSDNGEKHETGTITDIDGNTYRTVKIREQWWMAENLKVKHYRNGDAIPNVTDNKAWVNLKKGAYCRYDNDEAKAETFGNLYNWYAVNDPRCLAPKGWHVPSYAEWQKLVDYLGVSSVYGGKMKETAHWSGPNTGATNESGFSALPGGYCGYNGNFFFIGRHALFWSSTESNRDNAWTWTLHYDNSAVYFSSLDKRSGFSVRCVRD